MKRVTCELLNGALAEGVDGVWLNRDQVSEVCTLLDDVVAVFEEDGLVALDDGDEYGWSDRYYRINAAGSKAHVSAIATHELTAVWKQIGEWRDMIRAQAH